MLDTEEREHAETEITLGTATLLSIFFGLVVVCGVFFGFGYYVGRPTAHDLAPATTAPADTSLPAADTHSAKPTAQQAALTTVTQPASQSTEDTSSLPDAEAPDSRTVTVTEPSPAPAPKSATALRASTTPASTAPAAGAPSMVQIAAVSHQEDADVLVSALRKRGYNVSVRNEPQDKLLHVQVGPFATRAEAAAMKQKLLADGYNAFVK
jgi:DedD protein